MGSAIQGSAVQADGLGERLRKHAESHLSGDHLVERSIALVCLLILAVGCYLVMQPFLSSLLWSLILAISTWPLHVRLTRALGGRKGASAAILTVMAMGIFVIPVALLGQNLAGNVAELAVKVEYWRNSGIPQPPSWVATLPLLGSQLHQFWMGLATGSVETAATLAPYIQM